MLQFSFRRSRLLASFQNLSDRGIVRRSDFFIVKRVFLRTIPQRFVDLSVVYAKSAVVRGVRSRLIA